MKKNNKKEKHLIGIIILSILYFISFLGSLIIGLISILYPHIIKNLPPFLNNPTFEPIVFIIFGIIMIIYSILSLIISIGLYYSKRWSLVLIFIISIIYIIGGIFSILNKNYLSIINLLFNILILSYLIFNKTIRFIIFNAQSKPKNVSKSQEKKQG